MTQSNPCTRDLLARTKLLDGPPPRSKARIYRALTTSAAASAITLGVTSAEASLKATTSLLTMLTTGKVGILAAAGIGMVSGSLILAGIDHFVPSQGARTSPTRSKAVASSQAQSTLRSLALAPTVVVTELPLKVEVEKATPPALPSSPSPIAEETRLLAQVQRALREGDGQQALMLLGRYRRDFGTGALGEEAAAAEVFARCAVGDLTGAANARARFVQQFAGSPLEPRVESSCRSGADND